MKWAGSRDKIFSPSGRGRTFFLTSLFIELIGGVRAPGRGQNNPYLVTEYNHEQAKTSGRIRLSRAVSPIRPELFEQITYRPDRNRQRPSLLLNGKTVALSSSLCQPPGGQFLCGNLYWMHIILPEEDHWGENRRETD